MHGKEFFSSLPPLAASVICSSTLLSVNEARMKQIHESFSVQNQYIQRRSYLSYCDSSSILPPTNSCLTTQQSSQTCLFICSQPFPSLFFPCLLMVVQVCISTITKHLACCSRLERFFIFATCVSFFRPVLSFPVSIAQSIKMKIFGVFFENHLQHL